MRCDRPVAGAQTRSRFANERQMAGRLTRNVPEMLHWGYCDFRNHKSRYRLRQKSPLGSIPEACSHPFLQPGLQPEIQTRSKASVPEAIVLMTNRSSKPMLAMSF
jgi:hypothetical protein